MTTIAKPDKPETIRKGELERSVAERMGVSQDEGRKAVNGVFETITDLLASDNKVVVTGFGGWEVRDQPARTARHPRTGDPVQVPAKRRAVFKAGEALKNAVSGD